MANDFSEKSETLAKLDNAGIIMVSGIFLIGSLFITIVALPNFI